MTSGPNADKELEDLFWLLVCLAALALVAAFLADRGPMMLSRATETARAALCEHVTLLCPTD